VGGPDDTVIEDDEENVDGEPIPDEAIDDPSIPDKLYFRIGEVAQLVGVDSHVLRYWESEFKMRPHRSNSGQRLYRKQDLARFFRIKHLLHDEGYTIAGARKALAGGSGPQTVDVERLRKAVERLNALRRRLRAFRNDMSNPEGGTPRS
jgi:DNA-binding transcriptional MerR regulator